MHISEGVLSTQVIVAGYALTACGTAWGLKKLDYKQIAQAGVLASAFFVASLIHVNIGPSSVHLILSGIVGLFLGWGAFPAILTGLLLQAVFFQFGGITTLGVNTFNMAMPSVICFYLFRGLVRKNGAAGMVGAFLCGSLAIMLSAVMLALSLYMTEKNFLETAYLVVASNLPVMVIEGIITVFCIQFIKKVQPEMLLD